MNWKKVQFVVFCRSYFEISDFLLSRNCTRITDDFIFLREGSVIADFLVTSSTESNLTFQEDSLKFFKSVQTVGSVAGHILDTSYPIVKGDVQPGIHCYSTLCR